MFGLFSTKNGVSNIASHIITMGGARMAQYRLETSLSSSNHKISEYVGERTLTLFSDHMTEQYTFKISFQDKIIIWTLGDEQSFREYAWLKCLVKIPMSSTQTGMGREMEYNAPVEICNLVTCSAKSSLFPSGT